MNLSNKNIKIIQAFKSNELLWLFCVLFSTASVFLGNINFRPEKLNDSYDLIVNKSSTRFNFEDTLPATPLPKFEFVETSEISDDSDEDDVIKGDYSPNTLRLFTQNNAKNSSTGSTLSLNERVLVPLFLLHHSWKIPVA